MAGLADAFEQIGDAVEHYLPISHSAGVALGVTDGEELLGVVVRGMADVASATPVRPETRFEIGSISKQFSAIVALQEVEAGRLALDVSINEILPWLGLPEPFGPITLSHLMAHTSGLPVGTEESPTGPGAMAILRELQPAWPPGSRYHYSNDAWKLVGFALEAVTGKPIHVLLHERVLGPLGMGRSEGSIGNATRADLATGYETMYDDRPPNLNHPLVPARWLVTNTADGSIVSTVVDMATYARVLLGRGRTLVEGHEVRLLSDAMFEELVMPRTEMDEDDAEFDERYGYGVWTYTRDGRRNLEHSGGMVGYTARLTVDVDAGLGVIALQNGYGPLRQVTRYALDAVRMALAGEVVEPLPHPPAPTALSGAATLAGRYVGEGRTIEVQATSEGLRLVDGPVGVALGSVEDHPYDFFVPHPLRDRYVLRAIRGEDGSVREIAHGPERFAPEGKELEPPAAHDESWAAYPGVYRSNDPWAPVLRIFMRGGRLYGLWPSEAVEEELTQRSDGTFAFGDPTLPRSLRFGDVLDGRVVVVHYNGGRWYRSFEE